MKNRILKSVLAKTPALPILIASLLVLCATGHAQPYAIDWSTMDGGGGVSTGGKYTLAGSVAQPDAGTISGDRFTLEGGFSPGALVVPATGEAPKLVIQSSNLSVILSWAPATTGFTLEQTDDLLAPVWAPAPTGNPVTISLTNGTRFYRLRRP